MPVTEPGALERGSRHGGCTTDPTKPALTNRRRIGIAMLAGGVAGLAVLGVGGRLVMRGLTVALEEDPHFTVRGTLAVLVTGAGWGTLTGPLLVPIRRWLPASRTRAGLALGAAGLVLATLLLHLSADGGSVVAPPLFLALSAVSFTALFLAHGVAVERLDARWSGARAQTVRPSG